MEVDDSPDTVGPGELLVQVQQASSDLDIVMDVPCFATSHFNTKNYLVGLAMANKCFLFLCVL